MSTHVKAHMAPVSLIDRPAASRNNAASQFEPPMGPVSSKRGRHPVPGHRYKDRSHKHLSKRYLHYLDSSQPPLRSAAANPSH